MTAAQAIECLVGLESALMRASRLARDLQSELVVSNKSDTGNPMVDVVTQADLAVQRALLEVLVETPLVGCRLFSEEDSPALRELQSRFSANLPLTLTIDPVDGTRRFVEGTPFYSTIVGLTDGQRPLYHWLFYPSFEWWMRLTDVVEASGPTPFTIRLSGAEERIVYSNKRLERTPEWLEPIAVGAFCQGEELGPEGSKMLFMEGGAGGYLALAPNAYDGLVGLHYAQICGYEIRTSPGFSLAHPELGKSGWRYPGGYALFRKPSTSFSV